MKNRVIRLSESQLIKLVKRVIKENNYQDDVHLDPSPEIYMHYIDGVADKIIKMFYDDLIEGFIEHEAEVERYVEQLMAQIHDLEKDFMEDEDITKQILHDLSDYADFIFDNAVEEIYYMWKTRNKYNNMSERMDESRKRKIKENKGEEMFATHDTHGGKYYDKMERRVDSDIEFSETKEFGPEDYDSFMEYINNCDTRWCITTKKYYDMYAQRGNITVGKGKRK